MDYRDIAILPALRATLKRDLLLAARHPGEIINPLLFFIIVVTLIPLGLSPDTKMLSGIAPGILWVMALLSALLSLEGLFAGDYREGVLEQMLISPQPLYLLVLVRLFAHWLIAGVPLVVCAPLLGIMLALPGSGFVTLVAGLLMGTALFSLIGAIGAALTVALRRNGILLSLIVMPLYVPVLIFGAASVQRAVDGFSVAGSLAMLGAMLALALILAPLAIVGALRISMHG